MKSLRTCLGCRSRAPRTSLLRVVARSNESGSGYRLVVDVSAHLPGRGAWVHPRHDCIDKALQRRAFAHALRVRSPFTADSFEKQLKEQAERLMDN